MFVKIKGTGSCLPEKVLDNFEISQLVDTNDEWIQSRTGIKSRHIAREETAVSMAAKAAKRALEDAQVAAEEIDLLIVSSVSSEQLLPCTACSVQKEIGAVNAAAFDLNAACSGFIVAYQMAAGQIKAGLSKKALLIGVECLSNIVNWEDRGTCILFGDGAGAAVVSADEDGNIDGRGNIEIPSVLPIILREVLLGAGCLKCQRVELDRTTGGVLKTVIRGEQTKNTDLDLLEIKESGNSTYEIFLRGGGRKGEIVFTKFIKRMRFFDTVESVLF